MVEVVLLSNGPGELYTWAAPMLRELRARAPGLRVALGLLPCPFASGQEERIARGFGFDAVAGVNESLAFIAGGPKPKAFLGGQRGLVLGLGGDVAFPGRIAARLGYAAWRYSFEPYWNAGLERLFVPDARTFERARQRSGAVVEALGNLTADALAATQALPKQGGLDVLLMAGSRRFEVEHMLGLFAASAEQIARVFGSEVRFHWPRSRFLTDAMLEVAFSARKVLDLGGVPLRVEGQFLVTPAGVRIGVLDEAERYAWMKSADLALTIPGTNTLELGIAACVSLICLPLQKPELIPIENPLRYLQAIPFVGPKLKRALVKATLSRYRFVALPNMIANELIQPELRGNVGPTDIAQAALDLLSDPEQRAQIQAHLRQTMPEPGTAARLAERVLERIAWVGA